MARHKITLSDGSRYPFIPSICDCSCNEIIWNRSRFKRGHNNKTKEDKNFCYSINKERKFSESHRKNLGLSQIGNKKALGHKLKGKSKKRSSKTMFKKGQKPWNFGINMWEDKTKHPMWKGGKSFLPYCHRWTSKFRESIRTRDNHICQLCGKTQLENGRKLDVHHIHHDIENCFTDLITLCQKCNLIEVEKKDKIKYYEDLFMNMLNDRGLLFWSKQE